MKPNITRRQRGGQSWEVERLPGRAAEGCKAGKTKVKLYKPYHFVC